MKQALVVVGAVVLTAFLAAGAQKENWLIGGPQQVPTTAPTGEFPTNPALGASSETKSD